MDRVSLPLLKFAAHVLTLEARGAEMPEAAFSASGSRLERLRSQVVTLMGNGGFRALLTRALTLAQHDVTWLRGAHINADGFLEDVRQSVTPITRDQMTHGSALVLAHFFGLLVTFIGAKLTLNMVREVWPELSPQQSEFFIEGSSYGQAR